MKPIKKLKIIIKTLFTSVKIKLLYWKFKCKYGKEEARNIITRSIIASAIAHIVMSEINKDDRINKKHSTTEKK